MLGYTIIIYIIVVSDLHGVVKPAESKEPHVEPQHIEKVELVKKYTEAKLYKKLLDTLKSTFTHILYLSKYKG